MIAVQQDPTEEYSFFLSLFQCNGTFCTSAKHLRRVLFHIPCDGGILSLVRDICSIFVCRPLGIRPSQSRLIEYNELCIFQGSRSGFLFGKQSFALKAFLCFSPRSSSSFPSLSANCFSANSNSIGCILAYLIGSIYLRISFWIQGFFQRIACILFDGIPCNGKFASLLTDCLRRTLRVAFWNCTYSRSS